MCNSGARLSVLDRDRWTEVDRIPLPCAGIRSGSKRERHFGQLAMLEQVGVTPKRVRAVAEALPPELCRVRITAGPPRDVVTLKVLVAPPPGPGRYTLRLTLLQEGVQWFDDLDPANAVSGEVRIDERRRGKAV